MKEEPTDKHVVIFIDMHQVKLETDTIKVADLYRLAEEDPTETTIALKHGNELKKLTDLEAVIHLENGMKFVVLHNAPTPVS